MTEIERHEVLDAELVDDAGAEVALVRDSPGLSAAAIARLEDELSKNTQRVYESQWRLFVKWCAGQEPPPQPLPCHPDTLTNYAAHLMSLGRAANSIQLASAAIGWAHEAAGLERPSRVKLSKSMRSYNRERAEGGEATRKARVLKPAEFKQVCEACDITTPAGLRDRLFVLLAFRTGRRYSEIASLRFEDFQVDDDGLLYRVRKTKTDQTGAKAKRQRLRYAKHRPAVCVVTTFLAWRDLCASRGITEGVVIRPVDKHGRIGGEPNASGVPSRTGAISTGKAEQIWRRAVDRAHIDPTGITTHSGRRSAVTAAHRAGRDANEIADRFGYQRGSRVMLGYIEETNSEDSDPMDGIL